MKKFVDVLSVWLLLIGVVLVNMLNLLIFGWMLMLSLILLRLLSW